MKIDLAKISVLDFFTAYGYDESIVEQASKCAGDNIQMDLWQLTIKDFGMMMRGEVPQRLQRLFSPEARVVDFLRAKNAISKFTENFIEILKIYTLTQTADEIRAARGVPSYNENEGMLVFVRQYFGLRSFSEAEKVTLADFLLAKKDSYINATFQRNLLDVQKKEFNAKTRIRNGGRIG